MGRRALIPMAILLLTGLLAGLLTGCGAGSTKQTAPAPVAEPPPPVANATPTPPTPAPDPRPVIVSFGDSLTYGLGVPEKDNYPSRLQRRLDAEGYSYRVVNLGVSGDTTAVGLGRLQTALDLKPALLILELGANDALRGLGVSQMRSNLAKIIERSQAAGATVVLAGMQAPPNLGQEYLAAFARVYPELAAEFEVPLIPFFLEGVGGVRELNAEDGSGHPNAAGYRVVTETVWQTLKPLLQK